MTPAVVRVVRPAPSALAPRVLHPARRGRPLALSGTCVGCGQAMSVRHAECAQTLAATRWTPCLDCCGTRTDATGLACDSCSGVGFVELVALAQPAAGGR